MKGKENQWRSVVQTKYRVKDRNWPGKQNGTYIVDPWKFVILSRWVIAPHFF